MHKSIPLPNCPCEFIEITPYNPLISKCVIKVLYADDKPNRNGTIITKETAKKIANSLPGSPITGYFNEETNDFNEHDRILEIKDGKLKFTRLTRPYGFVDLNAKVWFQKFIDDDTVEREYLLTEGWLWTGQYPETQRIIEKGNNQSMEFDKDSVKGSWANSYKGSQGFFIINEAIISELCTLGAEVEPCFEGATITSFSLSFEEEFKSQLLYMMTEFNKIIEEGGTTPLDITIENEVQEVTADNGAIAEQVTETPSEPQVAEEYAAKKKSEEEEGKPVKKDTENSEESTEDKEEKKCSKCGKPQSECECEGKKDEEEKKKPTYTLEEIPEYVELATQFNALSEQNDSLKATIESLNSQIATLSEFKKTVERKDKEAMISSFTMLSDEDKLDVITNIDSYSLNDIEAKLAVICVRKRVSFSANEEPKTEEPITTFSLDAGAQVDDHIPDWVKAVRETARNMNI